MSEVINEFAVDATLLRRGAPLTLDGRVMPAPVVASAVRIGTHPSKGDVADFLPEAIRTRAIRTFYSTVELRTFREPGDISGAGDGDIIVYAGSRFEIFKSEPWNEGSYWRAFGAQMTKNAAVQNVYFGVAEAPETVDEDFILALPGVLPQASRQAFCAVDIVAPEVFWFALPAHFGAPLFTVDDEEIAMEAAQTVTVNGVSYDVYQSSLPEGDDIGDVIVRVE